MLQLLDRNIVHIVIQSRFNLNVIQYLSYFIPSIKIKGPFISVDTKKKKMISKLVMTSQKHVWVAET